jgi:hypothetical protein
LHPGVDGDVESAVQADILLGQGYATLRSSGFLPRPVALASELRVAE